MPVLLQETNGGDHMTIRNDDVICDICESSNLNESLTICFDCQALDYLSEEANEDVDTDNSL